MAAETGSDLGQTRALDVAPSPPAPAVDSLLADDDSPALLRPALDARRGGGSGTSPRYRVLGIEGIGATSRVYRAFDADLAREVALKVLNGHDAESFIAEARITAGMQHPNVLPVYELDEGTRGELYFSMRRIDGRSLGDALGDDGRERDQRFVGSNGVNAVTNVFIDVCQALAYAHHRGIVHQDVKPDNIMLGAFGEVLLVDWGSAARLDDPRSRLYGTPLYMSPEQARRDRAIPASDIFCVGASLFHALIGRPPTSADSLEELTERRCAGSFDAPTPAERRKAPAPLLHIALKAMAPAIADRYADAAAMLADLQAYQAGLSVAAYPEPPWQRLWRWYRRNRRACWAVAAATLALSVLIAALAAERAKRNASWRLDGEIDFATASPAEVERLLVARVKTADSGEPFHEEPLAGSTRWQLADGKLRLASITDYVDLAWRNQLAGDFRAEWDYTAEGLPLNLDCFVGDERESGYTFHVGTFSDPRCAMLTRGSTELREEHNLDQPLRTGRTYAFVLQRVGDRMRLTIDGATVFDYADRDPITAARATSFGLDCYRERAQAVRHLRVFVRSQPELVSPLAIGQALYQSGQWRDAVREYDAIARSHSNAELGLRAEAAAALCVARSGDPDEGDRRLRASIDHAQDSELILPAMIERELLLRAHGDAAGSAALRERLKRWRGEPMLRRVVESIAHDHDPLLQPNPVTRYGDPIYDADLGKRLSDGLAEVRSLADAYGVPLENIRFATEACHLLAGLGFYDEALAACPPNSRTFADLLVASGQYQAAIERYGYVPQVRARALREQGRNQEIADDESLDPADRATALVDLGRFDEALKRYPRSDAVGTRLLNTGRVDEFLAIHAGHERDLEQGFPFLTPRYRAMQARNQWEAILAEYQNPVCVAQALFSLGRSDEALARFPDRIWVGINAGFRALRAGDTERGIDLISRGRAAGVTTADDYLVIQSSLMAALLPRFLGERFDLQQALAPILEKRRWWCGQRLWHIAALISGRIDAAGFRAQPRQRGIDADLHVALALRAECLGRAAEAIAEYHAAVTAQGQRIGFSLDFIAWRLIALGDPDAPPRRP
jgi:hypothetical protein